MIERGQWNTWDELVVHLEVQLADSSTANRLNFLQNLSSSLDRDADQINDDELTIVSLKLLRTFNYYQDAKSRAAVVSVLLRILRLKPTLHTSFVKFVSKYAQSDKTMAISSLMTLLEWSTEFAEVQLSVELIESQALLAEKILDYALGLENVGQHVTREGVSKKEQHRKRVRSSVQAQLIASLQCIVKKDVQAVQMYVDTATAPSKTVPFAAKLALLGLLGVASTEAVPTNPAFHAAVQENVAKVAAFFNKEIVVAKSMQAYCLEVYARGVVSAFYGQQQLAELVPVLEKCGLRNSELAFAQLTPAIFAEIPESAGLVSVVVQNKMAGQLVANLKAAKDTTRDGSAQTLVTMIRRHAAHASAADLSKILDELLKSLKTASASAVDQKQVLCKVLAALAQPGDESLSGRACDALTPVVQKDQNEVSLLAELEAFMAHLEVLLRTPGGWQSRAETVLRGLQDEKKPHLKKNWSVAVAALPLVEHAEFLAMVLSALLRAADDVVGNPLASVASRSVDSAYVALVVAHDVCVAFGADHPLAAVVRESRVFERALAADDAAGAAGDAAGDTAKPSVVTSRRVYGKLPASDTEQRWFQRAVFATLDQTRGAAAEPVLFATLSQTVSPALRQQALARLAEAIRTCVLDDAGICAVIAALSAYLRTEHGTDGAGGAAAADAAADSGPLDRRAVPALLNVLTQSFGADGAARARRTVADLAVVAHCDGLHVKGAWVGLAQRAGVDPGAVVAEFGAGLVAALAADLVELAPQSAFYRATVAALATMAFIDSATVAPLLAELVRTDLAPARLTNVDALAVQIWQAADVTTPVVDVLAAEHGAGVDKNARDYETRKWEESVRKDVAAKRTGAPRRLTKEQQQQVQAQLATEAAVRAAVAEAHAHLQRGLAVVQQLAGAAVHVDNGVQTWFGVAVAQVLAVAQQAQAQLLLGDGAVRTFLQLGSVASSRLGDVRVPAGVATLRVLGVDIRDSSLVQEPLAEQVSRVLFRVKLVGVQRPLDAPSLVYLLPLLVQLLQRGRDAAVKLAKRSTATAPAPAAEFVAEDPEEEQLLLAMEIVATHAEAFADVALPRREILAVLMALMAVPARQKLAKECFAAVAAHVAVTAGRDDVELVLRGCTAPETAVRTAVLEVVDAEFDLAPFAEFSSAVWIAVHDTDAGNAELAATIWAENAFRLDAASPAALVAQLGHTDAGIRLSVSRALAAAVAHLAADDAAVFDAALDAVLALYVAKARPPAPVLDAFGLPVKAAGDARDAWEARSGAALAVTAMAPLFTAAAPLATLFRFLCCGPADHPEEAALADREPTVRQEWQDAGVAVVNASGHRHMEVLIPIFEAVLAAPDAGTRVQDQVRESVIILYGSVARHLAPTDARLARIVARLLAALDTPSEDVQFAVGACLAPLVPLFSEADVRTHVDAMVAKLFADGTLAARRGAAYGLAGLVKGAGVAALAKYDVVRTLVDASEDKKDAKRREGVAFAIECLSQSLGRLFEPYVLEVLPVILKQLGDSSSAVRDATDYATRVVMRHTTSFGVKQVIPVAIANLDDVAWRTKRGSVDLLGAMAYLDPAQLSASLSAIVPEIVAVAGDSHKEVRKSADAALRRFGEVIRNPEIQALVPALLAAIGDPTRHTDAALDALIRTQFVHYIDAPSLALVIHVVHRGMHDRSAATRRKACQIVGNMAILVDARDLVAYLPELVAELEASMVDPVPQTRATAARALGSLVEKLGEPQFPDLIPRLLEALQDASRAGDRLGSAQALAEIISALGTAKLDEMLPQVLAGAGSARPHVRSGFMPLLLFLPVCFGMAFSPYLDRVVPVILEGLAADDDVRDTALKAARLIVKNYATKAVDLLLPELERGLSDTSFRIRLSSVELTGELLFQIAGVSGKVEASEGPDGEGEGDYEDGSGNTAAAAAAAAAAQAAQQNVGAVLVQVLGQQTRDSVLASLFVCRQDTSALVRNATVDIWKALVANTPKTVKEILPTLTALIIRRLASSDEAQRNIAAQTLGETVRRVGANALPALLPTLEAQLVSSDADAKQGICIAARELIESASADTVREHQPEFVRIVRDALVDPSERVREAAASAFDVLQDVLGGAAVDAVVPQLLGMLGGAAAGGAAADGASPDAAHALAALQDIMSTKADVIFPTLIPTLVAPPLDPLRARALASLAAVAGPALYRRLPVIIDAFVERLLCGDAADGADGADVGDADATAQISASFDGVLLAVDSDDGLHPLLQQMLALMKHDDARRRAIMFEHLAPFFKGTHLDVSIYTQDILAHCVAALDDRDARVVRASFSGLTELVKVQSKESLERLVKPARQALAMTGAAGAEVAAFALPRGPNCLLPIFLHGLMYGSSDQREAAALAIADVVAKTPSANLKPFVTVIVGPLIRVIGERFSGDVKAAILLALNTLFGKIPQMLRPFIPQLQRTFVKSLADASNETLRTRAARALGTLIEYQPRVDPLVNELVGGCRAAADSAGVRTAMLKALLEVVHKAGSKMSEASKNSVMDLVEHEIAAADDKMAVAYARLVGSLSRILTPDEAARVLKAKVLDVDVDAAAADAARFAVLAVNAFLRDSPQHVFAPGLVDDAVDFVGRCCASPVAYISDNGVVAVAKMLLLHGETQSPFSASADAVLELPEECRAALVTCLATSMAAPVSGSLDTRRLALVAVRTVARFKFDDVVRPHIRLLAPCVFGCVRDVIIPIKLAAEKAFLAIFQLVEDDAAVFFNEWLAAVSAEGSTVVSPVTGAAIQVRSIGDYSRRVAVRLAGVERERIAAGGDDDAMFSDRFEDETELWAVGGVDLGAA